MEGGVQPLNSHEARELKRQQKLEQRRQQSAVAQGANKKRRTTTYAVGVLVVLALVAGFWFFSSGGVTGAVAIDIGSHPVLGAATAPITMVVFGDFQCPFTRKFWQGAFPKILDKYGDKLKVVYWPVPTAKHNYDRASAEAAYCADEQGKFWEYANIILDRQGAALDANLADYARELKLDVDAFRACYDSNRYEAQVQEDYVAGRKHGVVQTPTVAINEHVLSGDLAFEEYKVFIDYELANP
jgi:protein-disulfide isomerase